MYYFIETIMLVVGNHPSQAIHKDNLNHGFQTVGDDPFRGHISNILQVRYLHYNS